MNETRIIAAILAAGVLSTSTKSATPARAIAVYSDLLDALSAAEPASVINQPSPRRDEAPRVQWLNGRPPPL